MRPLRVAPWVITFVLVSSTAPADDFSSFRIPDHFGGFWTGRSSGAYSSSSHNEPGEALRSSVFNGSLYGNWDRFRDSDRWQWDVLAFGNLSGARGSSRRDEFVVIPGTVPTVSSAVTFRQRDADTDEQVGVTTGARAYPWTAPFGAEITGQASLFERQRWVDQFETDIFRSFSESRLETSNQNASLVNSEAAEVSATLGYGRVRDASPVFLAILLEERLRRDGALKGALSSGTRQRIADLYSIRASFSIPHDQSDKFFWSELERLLREDAALVDTSLDAYAIRHADEALVVARSSFQRPIGFFFGPTLFAQHRHSLNRTSFSEHLRHLTDGVLDQDFIRSGSSRFRSFRDHTEYGGSAEFDQPIGSRSQIRFAEVCAVDPRPEPNRVLVDGSLSFQRLVGERWFSQFSFTHSRDIDPGRILSAWQVVVAGEVDYYLEDFARVTLSADQFWVRQLDGTNDERDVGFSARVGLELGRGWLDAPGLIRPQRAMN